VAELGFRLTGSSDLYESDGRRPHASINFVTAHDGFTLNDLVSFNQKHNEANGEDNRDGENHNLSFNFGVEGPTDDPDIIAQRDKQRRNFIVTLLLSQGVPMLCAGDEMGRTQGGNNNAYAQDNEISWLHWDLGERDERLLAFTRRVSGLRDHHPVFRRRHFFQGRRIRGSELDDITWLSPDGTEMTEERWNSGNVHCFGMMLGGDAMLEWDEKGERVVDDTFLLLFNADPGGLSFQLPATTPAVEWEVVVSTVDDRVQQGEQTWSSGAGVPLEGRAILVRRRLDEKSEE
jgi:glycogen operon protein